MLGKSIRQYNGDNLLELASPSIHSRSLLGENNYLERRGN